MRTLICLGCVAASFFTADSALAADSGEAAITASVTAECQINAGTSTLIDLTGAAVNTPVAGVFNYQCNFANGPTTITIQSANGGLLNGPSLVNYGIFLNDQTPAALGAPLPLNWFPASSAVGLGGVFHSITVPTAANTPKLPFFYVGLRAPLTLAGTYNDMLTISISP